MIDILKCRIMQNLFIIFTISYCYAFSNFDTLWTKTYDLGGTDSGITTKETLDKGFISLLSSDTNKYLMKADNNGSIICSKKIRNSALSIHETTDTGFIMATTAKSHPESLNCYLIKYDKSFDSLWSKPVDKKTFSVLSTTNYELTYLTSFSFPGNWSRDISLNRIDKDGNLLVNQRIMREGYDLGSIIAETSDKGFLIKGNNTNSAFNPPISQFLVKTDKDGVVEWDKIYRDSTSNRHSYLISIIESSQQGFYIYGTTAIDIFINDIQKQIHEYWIEKIDINSQTIWTKKLYTDLPWLIECSDQSILIFAQNFLTQKIDKNGDSLWTKTITDEKIDSARLKSVKKMTNNTIILLGEARLSNADNFDLFIMEIDENGAILWIKTIGGNKDEQATDAIKTSDGSLIILGSTNRGENKDIFLVKLGSGTLISHKIPKPNKSFLLYNNPNPFKFTTTITYALQKKAKVEVTIYDLQGNRIKSLYSGTRSAGNHCIVWNTSDIHSGIYICNIKVPSLRINNTIKLVLSK